LLVGVAFLVVLALLLIAGGGPLLPALTTFALGVLGVLIVAWVRRLALLARERRALERSQQEFATNAAHQLRTPLTALRPALDDLAARVAGTPLATPVDSARSDAERLSALTAALLELSSAGSSTERTDLGEIAATAVAAQRPAAAERDVERLLAAAVAATLAARRREP
jgi:signal transduction histidine kinase